jgi:hypothetical protein
MENTENTQNNPGSTPNSKTSEEKSCCTSTLFSKDEYGNKKLSLLSWSILLVLLIGAIGIISSNRDNQRKLVQNTDEEAVQLQRQADVLKDKAFLKSKSQVACETKELQKEEDIDNRIKQLQAAHNKQLQEVQKAFEGLRASYAQKLNAAVETLKAEQEAKEADVPNPELNFQLRGLSNVRVEFTKSKDISYIEIIQPENYRYNKDKKSWKSEWKPKKESLENNCDVRGVAKNWDSCEDSEDSNSYDKESCDSPCDDSQKQNDDDYNSWDCSPKSKSTSNCGSY